MFHIVLTGNYRLLQRHIGSLYQANRYVTRQFFFLFRIVHIVIFLYFVFLILFNVNVKFVLIFVKNFDVVQHEVPLCVLHF